MAQTPNTCDGSYQGMTSVMPLEGENTLGFSPCVATRKQVLWWNLVREERLNEPRSGVICVSRGREPAIKWEK